MPMSIPVLQVNKNFRQTFVSSSKGDQFLMHIVVSCTRALIDNNVDIFIQKQRASSSSGVRCLRVLFFWKLIEWNLIKKRY